MQNSDDEQRVGSLKYIQTSTYILIVLEFLKRR